MTLKDLATAYMELKYKAIPAHCRPVKKFTDNSANNLTTAILAYFEIQGVKAWRQASEGRYLPEKRITNVIGQSITVEKGRFIPRGKATKGIGDICAVVMGQFITIEVKYGKDYQRPEQKEFQKDIEASGGIYFIVKTWDDFQYMINKYIH